MSNYFGEFFGTMILIIFGVGVVANVVLSRTKAEGGGWMAITTGWGFAVMIAIFCAISAGSSQADLNPAVTLAKTMMGIYQPGEAIILMFCQLVGAFVGACIVWIHFGPHWEATEDSGLILAVFATGPAIRKTSSNLISEIIGTTLLVLPVFSIFGKNTFIPPSVGPFISGILIWAIGLSLGGTTGYSINPARDLGPRLAHAVLPIPGKGDSDWQYSWIPVVGPFIGAIIAFLIAKAIGII